MSFLTNSPPWMYGFSFSFRVASYTSHLPTIKQGIGKYQSSATDSQVD